MDARDQFRDAIAAAGLIPPEQMDDTGKLHRFASDGRRGDDAGWYVFNGDGIPAGAFGCWRMGLVQHWCAKSPEAMTQAEREGHRQRVQAMKRQRDADTAQRQRQAADTAAARWQAAQPAPADHAYLRAKGVQAHGIRTDAAALLIPLRDAAGALHSLQLIEPDGDKRFMPGGRVKGCYHSIGKPTAILIVCEGYATGASIHEATGQAVAVAFNAGNLLAVAQALRTKYPNARLILAADDDWRTDGNPGKTKAAAAAAAVGGLLAVPVFPTDRSERDSDFNDLHRLAGADAVRACVEAAQGVAAASPEAGTNWPDPVPLPDALPAVEAFDFALLPESLRPWVADIAHRMQCPPDFAAVGALVALSGLIGARAVIAPKARDDWRVVPNLWGLVVGRPGVKKSPALGEVLKPLHRLEATERELHKAAREAWELDCKVAELAAKANEKAAAASAAKDPAKARALLAPADKPAEPTMRRYIVNDATPEKLADLLTVNPWGLLVYRDELHSLLCSMDKQGQEQARGFYLTGYDGDKGNAVDRIGRGESYVPRVCMAMLGGIQPGMVQSYVREAVREGAGADGLLQRFGLAVWPDIAREFDYVDQWPDAHAKAAAWGVFERLAQLQPGADGEPQEWRFSPEAQGLYVQWATELESVIRGDGLHPALIAHLAKYRKLIPALALIFALVDTPDAAGVIGVRELERACAWGEYLRTHAERLYAAASRPETAGAADLLGKIKAGRLCDRDGVLSDTFTPREVAVKGWTGLGTPDAVRKAADLLADYGWLVRDVVPAGAAGGRPSERYRVNPATLQRGY